MRSLLLIGTALLAAGCTMQPVARPTAISWQYGTGNGDPVANPSPKPVYVRSFGYGNGDPVKNGQDVKTAYVYGGENGVGMPIVTDTPAK